MKLTVFVLAAIGTLLQVYSAYLFAKTWLMPDSKIQALSATKYGSNPNLFELFKAARKSTYQGLFFLATGMIITLMAMFLQSFN